MPQRFSRRGIREGVLLQARNAFDERGLAPGRRALRDLDEREKRVVGVIAKSGSLVVVVVVVGVCCNWCGRSEAEQSLDRVGDRRLGRLHERVEDPPLGKRAQLRGILRAGASPGRARLFGAQHHGGFRRVGWTESSFSSVVGWVERKGTSWERKFGFVLEV